MTKFKKTDLFIGGSIVVLALLGILVAIPSGVVSPGEVDIAALSPAFWPRVVLIGLAIAGSIILFQGFFPGADTSEESEFQEFSLPFPVVIAKLVIAITVLFSYYFAIDEIGIVLSSVITLLLLMLLGGERRGRMLLSVSILLPVLLFYFFTYVANVPLPLGMFQS